MQESANQKIDKVIIDEELNVGIDTSSVAGAAISLATPCTIVTSAGAEARTLANGREGQRKIIVGGTTVTGNITVTPASMQGYTNVVIGAAGRGAELIFSAGKWHCFALGGATVA